MGRVEVSSRQRDVMERHTAEYLPPSPATHP
jgi:hypothetical protein